MHIVVDQKLTEKGIKVAAALFAVPEVKKKRGNPLDRHIKEVISRLSINQLLQSPILAAYRKFYDPFSLVEAMPPAEHLLKIIQRSQMLPNINNVVDSYNSVSAETLLSIGAHATSFIKGDLVFKLTTGVEHYIPLGKSEPEKVFSSEYACMDEEKIICRMDLKQCDETKVGNDTKEFIIYVQGNSETSDEYVRAGLEKVASNIVQFCGGSFTLLGGASARLSN